MKAFRYQVTITINKVELSVKFPCSLQVMWKRGLNKCLTRTKEKTRNNIFIVNEALTLDFTVGENLQKKTYLIALLNVEGQSKLAGVVNFNINESMLIEGQCVLGLERSPDPNAKIHFTYQVVNLGEAELSESRVSESFQHKTLGESFGQLDKENIQHVSQPLSQKKSLHTSNTTTPNKLEIQLTKELYEKSLRDLDQQKIKNITLIKQIEELKQEKQPLLDELSLLKKNIIELKNENEYLEQQCDNQNKEIQKLKENSFLVAQLQVQIEKLNHQIDSYKIQVQVLENKYQQSFKKVKQLEEKNDMANFNKIERATNTIYIDIPEFTENQKTIKELELSLSEFTRKNEKLLYDVQISQSKYKTAEQEISQLKIQLVQFKTQNQQLKDSLQGQDNENQLLKQNFKQLESQVFSQERETQKTNYQSKSQIDQLQEQLKNKGDQFEQLKEKYQLLKDKVQKQNDIIEQQNEELTFQNIQCLKELQILSKRQEQFGIA